METRCFIASWCAAFKRIGFGNGNGSIGYVAWSKTAWPLALMLEYQKSVNRPGRFRLVRCVGSRQDSDTGTNPVVTFELLPS